MHLNPSKLWAVSLGSFFTTGLALPALRPLLWSGLLLHLPPLIWGIVDLRSGFFCPALTRIKPGTGRIALTFDDGPDIRITPEILDLLARFQCKATFFIIAASAKRRPDLVRRAFAEGHVIGCHDLHHHWWSNFRGQKAMVRDIRQAQEIIASITGHTPLLYRPPMGLANPHLPAALTCCDMRCVGWSRRSVDAGNRRKGSLERIPLLACDGAVVLLHDCLPREELKRPVLHNLEALLNTIRRENLEPVGVDALFGIQAYGPVASLRRAQPLSSCQE